MDPYSLPSKWYKCRSGSSDKAFVQAGHSKESKTLDSGSKGHDDAETMMAGKLDHRQSRSVDFQKCALMGRKKNKLSAAFNSKVMNNIEASSKKVDPCQKCDDKQGPSLKKLDSHENCDDKQSQEHLTKSLAFSGVEMDEAAISADDELVSSVVASETRRAHRKGHKRPSPTESSKTIVQKSSDVKGKPLATKKSMHYDKSKVDPPDQLSVSTTSQLDQKECSTPCPNDLLSHKSTSHNRKTEKLKPGMPGKLTSKHPQSPSKINMTTDSTIVTHFIEKVANNQGPQMKGFNAACCSIVHRPIVAAQNDSGPHSKDKRTYTSLKQLANNMSNYLDSVAEVYPEKISLDVVNYFSADNLTQDITFGSQLQESKINLSQNDIQQRNETRPNSFPISSEMFSMMTNQFVERLTDSRLEIPDKCNTGTGPKCESKASSKHLTALKFPNSQSAESTGNLHTGGNVSTACGSVPESNPNIMSASASVFSESVEPSIEASRSTSTQKSLSEKYPVQDNNKPSSRPGLVSKQKSEPGHLKRPWRSSSRSQSVGPISDTTIGRRDGLGYASSPSLQKKQGPMKTDLSQAKLGYKCMNPRHLAPSPLLKKPVRGKAGYAAMAKQVSWIADGKRLNSQKSTQQTVPIKCYKKGAQTSITIGKNEQ